jgi:TIR domain
MRPTRADATKEVFCMYADKDLRFVEELHLRLRPHKRINCWYEGLINLGRPKEPAIEAHLNNANIILLFVSPDFLSCDPCMENQLPIALERCQRDEALVIIPIILRACDWKTTAFGKLQVLPKNKKPISRWLDQDEAWDEVIKGIQEALHHEAAMSPEERIPSNNEQPVPSPKPSQERILLKMLPSLWTSIKMEAHTNRKLQMRNTLFSFFSTVYCFIIRTWHKLIVHVSLPNRKSILEEKIPPFPVSHILLILLSRWHIT